ncbi:MAG: hypothetical protein WBW75_23985 [Mycobacterium sp.]|uniref:hypothetical protein n=1 Tax=Mycobacterium sp. TaxID=1785 RepID=UPI003C5D44E3
MTGADVPKELRNRDPEFIRAVLPTLWLASTVWFRAEVHGLNDGRRTPKLGAGRRLLEPIDLRTRFGMIR